MPFSNLILHKQLALLMYRRHDIGCILPEHEKPVKLKEVIKYPLLVSSATHKLGMKIIKQLHIAI